MRRALLAIMVVILGLAACATPHRGVTDDRAAHAGTLSTQAEAPKATSAPNCPSRRGGSFDPAKTLVGAQLVDVRVGTHRTYDRVTFQFTRQDGVPPFEIRSVSLPIEDPSGRRLGLEGTAYAAITFQHASGFDLANEPTYTGPNDIRPRFAVLQEARRAGDFERVLTWAFGLVQSKCFRAFELMHPARLVVDFPHDATPQTPNFKAVLRAFMDARMSRYGAEQYLGAQAASQYARHIGGLNLYTVVSNPHYARYEIISSKPSRIGSFQFVVRIHEAITGTGETGSFRETIVVGPASNSIGQARGGAILSAHREPGCRGGYYDC